MVKIEPKIELGKSLLELLDLQKTGVSSYFWFYLSNSNSWRLVIAAKVYENKEMKDNYKDFIERFGDNEIVKQIGLSNITIISNSDNFLNLFRSAIKTNSTSIAGIRFTSNIINGVLIEDAYIYRLS